MTRIYLDHNATTPTHPEVVKAMLPYYEKIYGNASSIHQFGQEARKAVDEAREKVASFIGAKPEEIVFTSGGTEADNFAIKGVAYKNEKKGRDPLNRACSGSGHIITSSIEHHAVLNPCKYLEEKGFKVTYLPVNEYGVVNLADINKAIISETILITIMHANNEVGTIEPIEEIGKMAKEKGIIFHTDAVQSVGKLKVNAGELNVDLLSLSGHKIYGPKGIGALYIRKGTKIEPLILGGHHERNKRAGTENVPGIVGFGRAIEIASQDMQKENKKIVNLRDKLWNGLRQKIDSIQLNGHPEKRTPNTLNVSFKFIEGESIILNLDLQGVAVSSGSACTSGLLESSHVLKAMGVDPATAQGSVRFSLGRDNTEEDIDYVLQVLPDIVSRLREMSPLYRKN
ncbi:MAG: cysteine desulfurase NifS [Candidatus Omnitrophica bacterium]|nr:cysteine desulfurase NifS [Candidatus Omnitrophota bacterium]MBU1047499.1 cysteine desulfurase NifS [Candidatus Omnitrophota bacterium]MBU1631030.1 cysteine desulfurase NifS [Candidatus Omnitrophota bacterium]MBU1766689.1 cysteine desulfurase NifS [Candidatus Omnitrophota bacterium]MBU1888862.1 cysteine desulfurase NifS [Candidatus Omnitrophota bacterium]